MGYRSQNKYSISTTDWEGLYKVVLHRDGILLYVQEVMFVWVPASAFVTPEEFQAAIGLIPRGLIRKK